MKIDFKIFGRKIDIFIKNRKGFWQYECSTKASPTCKEAKHNFCVCYALDPSQVKCRFSSEFAK